jgi:hypothetical protein
MKGEIFDNARFKLVFSSKLIKAETGDGTVVPLSEDRPPPTLIGTCWQRSHAGIPGLPPLISFGAKPIESRSRGRESVFLWYFQYQPANASRMELAALVEC